MGDKSSEEIWHGNEEDDAVYCNRDSDDDPFDQGDEIPETSNMKESKKARHMSFWEFKMINDILIQKSRSEYPGYQSSKDNKASAVEDIKALQLMTR